MPYWSRDAVAAAVDSLEGQLRGAAAAAAALDKAAWQDTGDPNQPTGYWEMVAVATYDEPDHAQDAVSEIRAMKARVWTASDAELRVDWDKSVQLEARFRGVAVDATVYAEPDSPAQVEGIAARNGFRQAQDGALRLILGYQDLRRNLRRAAARSLSAF